MHSREQVSLFNDEHLEIYRCACQTRVAGVTPDVTRCNQDQPFSHYYLEIDKWKVWYVSSRYFWILTYRGMNDNCHYVTIICVKLRVYSYSHFVEPWMCSPLFWFDSLFVPCYGLLGPVFGPMPLSGDSTLTPESTTGVREGCSRLTGNLFRETPRSSLRCL